MPFFALFYLLGSLVDLLEHTVHCFPITVVTSDSAVVERLTSLPGNCTVSVETEKFMIESAIFNDTDLPPVRDIHLVMLETNYHRWEDIKRLPGAVAEMNPFLKRAADLYLEGKIKLFAMSFALGIIVAVFTFPVAIPLRTPFRRLDRAAALFGGILFFFLSVTGFFIVPRVFRGAYLLSVGVGLVFVLLLSLLMRRYGERREGR